MQTQRVLEVPRERIGPIEPAVCRVVIPIAQILLARRGVGLLSTIEQRRHRIGGEVAQMIAVCVFVKSERLAENRPALDAARGAFDATGQAVKRLESTGATREPTWASRARVRERPFQSSVLGTGESHALILAHFRLPVAIFLLLSSLFLPRRGVRLGVNFLQTRDADVRIDLRGGDAGVPQHFLDLPEIGATGQ